MAIPVDKFLPDAMHANVSIEYRDHSLNMSINSVTSVATTDNEHVDDLFMMPNDARSPAIMNR